MIEILLLVTTVCWEIWNKRNMMILQHHKCSDEQVVHCPIYGVALMEHLCLIIVPHHHKFFIIQIGVWHLLCHAIVWISRRCVVLGPKCSKISIFNPFDDIFKGKRGGVAIPKPDPTRLADPDRNPGDARPKPSIKTIYSYKRFRSQIFAEADSI